MELESGEKRRERMVNVGALGSVGVTYLWNYGAEVREKRSER